jgi:two-component system phosphate regulon sensor histidine kinase PhoR
MIPTVLMTAIGIVLLAIGGSKSMAVVGGILVLSFCAMALTGYTIGTIFVTRGASLASVQNEFLASVSHELRTPLTSIRMFIDTLRDESTLDPAEKNRCLTIIQQEINRLDGLVERLIALSKIEHRHAAFERLPVNVSDIVSDALAAFQAATVGGDVEVRVNVESGLRVSGDRTALTQAVANLLGNAWKYSPEQGKQITIAAMADKRHVTIAVSDNGEGVRREEQRTIFEKFHRGSSAESSGSPGSGLGLAIVQAIVQAHHGSVDVQSDGKHGACFRIVLPRNLEPS